MNTETEALLIFPTIKKRAKLPMPKSAMTAAYLERITKKAGIGIRGKTRKDMILQILKSPSMNF